MRLRHCRGAGYGSICNFSPAQGFKTSFVAEQLKKYGYEILEVEDEEMENSPEDRVY